MAVTGTNTFTVTRNDIIDAALRTLGVIGLGETPSSEDYTNCTQALNIMIKGWAKKGFPLWTVEEATFPSEDGTRQYDVTDVINKPLRIMDARISDANGDEVPLTILSKQEYDRIGDKTIEGKPYQIYFDNQLGTSYIYSYPVPDSADYNFIITSHRMFYDMTNSTDSLDFPQEWFQAIKWGLAAEIAVEYGIPIDQVPYYEEKSMRYIQDAFDFSVEEPSVFFTVDTRG